MHGKIVAIGNKELKNNIASYKKDQEVNSVIFWDIMPCSPLKVKPRNISPSSLTLKMGEICSTETSIDFRRTTGLYVPEDSTLHNYQIILGS
jgi:hypothetical protein